ncbi:deoxyadenosine/deoxycytidine kinase [Kushneria sinocarnis]|uniref:Deoxyadenosine/deoxycytidine kinase n=1 Tax=Kushneria sinocarnis TaxID=595502 RepID=A0A420WWU1_9GAMM|nr:deoxynucleoside kinase [Kushneria sinocarnis]RKR04184.1 deoxyadenosine/deoxycytidine kinase [Kushneria sinocarnis]
MMIAFEGPIGVGKTTLAEQLADFLGPQTRLLLEDFAGNAFLDDFYAQPERWALPAQLEFLVSRHEQLSACVPDPAAPTIADHSLMKDRIFAELLLSGRERALYDRLAARLQGEEITPDVLIYLDAETGVLLERIARRGRTFERDISGHYLKALRQGYERHLAALADSTLLLRLDTSNMVPTSANELASLWHRIQHSCPE